MFMKHGCNNGSCHGAARGKDGFMLSLFGYDPAGDYYRLTRQIVGRRVDLAVPEKSLMLEKVTGAVPHTGGKLFDTDHDDYQTLLRWLQGRRPGRRRRHARAGRRRAAAVQGRVRRQGPARRRPSCWRSTPTARSAT